eukprot:CAMPEP_0194275250 /NCGR_PEP_ID=MMETSP0169-20130528/8141_1 /TAXON_ID=218684 /ORGANISM="Corethron pennatum, Strain L29A3" /LENGTH=650 /DNA_ID=CAMNT_0039018669 /DNA_START=116 /DNA_END=2068 /DNA_ORIENTATION=+
MIFRSLTPAVFGLLLPAALSQADDFFNQDYSIGKPSLTIQNEDGLFAVSLGYKVGKDTTSFKVTLMNNDCETEYTANKVMKLQTIVQSALPDASTTETAKIIIYRDEFGESPLVTPSDTFGYSAGDLEFCVKAESYVSGVSVVFYKERIKISYDLTMNSFQLGDIALSVDNFSPMGPNTAVTASADPILSTCTATEHIVDYSDRVPDAVPVTIPFTQEGASIVGQTVTFKCGGTFYITILTHPDAADEKSAHLTTHAVRCQEAAGSVPGRKLAGLARRLDARLPTTITGFNVVCDPAGDPAEDFTQDVQADVVSKIEEQLYMARHAVRAHYDPAPDILTIIEANVQTKEYTTQLMDFTSTYGISACRCPTTSYVCATDLPALKQNELLSICMETDDADVSVSNFNMALKQGGAEVYSVASIGNNGPVSSSLSVIFNNDDQVRVVSRVVSALFDAGEESFDVEGNAFLEFNERRTRRRRRLQALPEPDATEQVWYKGAPVGNSPFSMQIRMDKTAAVDTQASSAPVMWLSVMGGIVGCLGVLMVGLLVFQRRTGDSDSKDEDLTGTDPVKNASVHSSNTDESPAPALETTDATSDTPLINVADAGTDQGSGEEDVTGTTDEQNVEDVLIDTTDPPSSHPDKTETDFSSGIV